MFNKETPSAEEFRTGLLAMTAVSIAITLPFIFIAKSMADSLHSIAADKAIKRARKYGE